MKKSGLGKLLAGVGLGVGLGMLFAPKSGKETREDIKDCAEDLVSKAKKIDLNELKDSLLDDFDHLKKQLKDMDADKAKKMAKEKGKEITDKAEELMEAAKKAGAPMIEKTARDVKKKMADILSDLSKKLEEE